MIVVIQCAARKRPDAGFLRDGNGTRVLFVADPDKAPPTVECRYARPDDLSENGVSWRETLLQYNQTPAKNPLNLCPAYRLYENEIYRRLVDQLGIRKTYVLSAGWGLINASFLTPNYDITFSPSAEPYKRRKKASTYHDLRMLPDDIDERIIFFGGKDYVPLFCTLTRSVRSAKTIFYNSESRPEAPGYSLERFLTTTRTNWQYECANAFLDGKISSAAP